MKKYILFISILCSYSFGHETQAEKDCLEADLLNIRSTARVDWVMKFKSNTMEVMSNFADERAEATKKFKEKKINYEAHCNKLLDISKREAEHFQVVFRVIPSK